MAPLSCGCEKAVSLCPTAERLWEAYKAALDIEQALFAATFADDDPIAHDRHRLAYEVRRQALRKYERHVDGEDEPVPEPQSIRADLRVVS